ncbi:polysaccharide deacetylase family protein [Ihubacter sp. rT4E-8]|uniref:M23 family metallopeptidase n=1 Tax=unclassified Ihubacter TaxID=2633299 RepID=UPI00137A7113
MAKKFLSFFLICMLVCTMVSEGSLSGLAVSTVDDGKDLIKWVDFDISYEALADAMELDIETWDQDLHISWIDALSYLAARYGGSFSGYHKEDLISFAETLEKGKSIEDITKDIKYFDYYKQAYTAVIGGFLGLRPDGTYGLVACSPIAEGYWYTDSDDFGNGRSYGFARKHLGHDMFCSTGTPVIAVEGGKVEALGWNQYGGWRIGIRSHDGSRYYYYAHLRKDAPFAKGLKIGSKVEAGQLIGYSGQTGYSIKENVNNINVPHLHFGMQLIFDESQKECNSEIWIDTYALIRLLSKHRSSGAADAQKKSQQSSAAVSASSAEQNEKQVQVPILMYHGLTQKSNQVNDYFIPVETFKNDVAWLKENGYTAVTMQDLIDYVYDKSGDVSLPQKPVVITFDDGYYNNHKYGTPILKEYGMKAVISVIGSACEEAAQAEYRAEDYCNATWNQLKEMASSGLWEIQNHSYDLHKQKNGRKGARIKAGETQEKYEEMLQADLTQLQKKLKETTGVSPITFTWPFGAYTDSVRPLLKKMNFRATLSCRSGINTLTKGDTEGLYLLKRNIRKPGVSMESILKQ